MRMKLSMLFIAISMIALVFGILFMTPLFIAGAFCIITLILTPAIWLTGAIYARGIWRPFFMGGVFTGFVPHLILVIYGIMGAISSGSAVIEKGLNLGIASEELLKMRLLIAGIWSVPGVFAFAGGGVSALTYRILRSGNAVEPQINSLTQPIDLS